MMTVKLKEAEISTQPNRRPQKVTGGHISGEEGGCFLLKAQTAEHAFTDSHRLADRISDLLIAGTECPAGKQLKDGSSLCLGSSGLPLWELPQRLTQRGVFQVISNPAK